MLARAEIERSIASRSKETRKEGSGSCIVVHDPNSMFIMFIGRHEQPQCTRMTETSARCQTTACGARGEQGSATMKRQRFPCAGEYGQRLFAPRVRWSSSRNPRHELLRFFVCSDFQERQRDR